MKHKQAEAEVVPSSSLVEIEVWVDVVGQVEDEISVKLRLAFRLRFMF